MHIFHACPLRIIEIELDTTVLIDHAFDYHWEKTERILLTTIVIDLIVTTKHK